LLLDTLFVAIGTSLGLPIYEAGMAVIVANDDEREKMRFFRP